MEIDAEMTSEEHLEDEDQPVTSTIKCQDLATNNDKNKQMQRRKLLLLIALHMQNFHRAIVTNRRRCLRRTRRRQSLLRAFFVQKMLEIETSFMELLLPLPDFVPHNLDFKRVRVEAELENTNGVDGFFEHALTHFGKEQWLEKFRMSKRTFRWLCAQFKEMPKQVFTLEKSLAIALYAFSTAEDYRTIGNIFNTSYAVVKNCAHRFAASLIEKLGGCLIAMPKNAQEYQEIRLGFQQASNMPALAVGVLGLFELSVCCPLQKKESSIILQALIDDRLLFRKVQVDSKRPTLLLRTPNEITKLDKQQINERLLPSFVIAPPAYSSLRPWLLQRYDEPIAPHEYDFNEAVDDLLTMRDKAFRRLFGRWKILQRKFDLDAQTMELFAVACCALHNLLEECEEKFNENWANAIDTTQFNNMLWKPASLLTTLDSPEAYDMRDFLARTISSTEM